MTVAWPRFSGDTANWAGRLLFALEQQQQEQQALNNRVGSLEQEAGEIGLEFPIRVDLGGTGGSSREAAQVNLGLRPGADVQVFSQVLASLVAQPSGSDLLPYFSNVNTFSLTPITTKGREILSKSDAAGIILALGLGTMALQNANAVAITGGSGLFRTLQLQDEVDGAASVGFFNTYPHMSGRMELDIIANGVNGRFVANGAGGFYIQSIGPYPTIFTVNNFTVQQMNVDGSATYAGIVRGITAAPGTNDARFATTAFVTAGFQPLDAELAAIAGADSLADRLFYYTGVGTGALTTFTSTARDLLDDANIAAMQATLTLVPGTHVQAFDADLSALAALATAGLIARTGAGTAATRTITGTADQITLVNGSGVSGDPTISLPSTVITTVFRATSSFNLGANIALVISAGGHAFRGPDGARNCFLNTTALNSYQETEHRFLQQSGGGTIFAQIDVNGIKTTAKELRIGGDIGGQAAHNTLTGVSDITANSTGVGTILFKGTTNRNSTGFIKFYIGTTAYYVPVFSAITG